MFSGARIRKCMAVTALIVSVLASLLQFHSHDCGGHVRLDCNGHEFVLGCSHHETGCADYCSNQHNGGTHHNHSNHDCPLHFQSPALFSDQRYHDTPSVTFDFVAELTAGTELTSEHFVTNEKVGIQNSPNLKLIFLRVAPLRGSPVCI